MAILGPQSNILGAIQPGQQLLGRVVDPTVPKSSSYARTPLPQGPQLSTRSDIQKKYKRFPTE